MKIFNKRFLFLAYFLINAKFIFAQNKGLIFDPVYLGPVDLVKVEEDRRLNMYCTGSGRPVVIFDSGLGDSTKAWGLVQPGVSKFTKACSYDRAGLGFSDPSNKEGTSLNAVKDLKQLLKNAKIKPPYILVGHSYGGMNVKLFAFLNPDDVAGLVLVDPTHEQTGQDVFKQDPLFRDKNRAYLKRLKTCLNASSEQLHMDEQLNNLCVGKAGDIYSEEIITKDYGQAINPNRVSAWISEMTNIWTISAPQVKKRHRFLDSLPIVLFSDSPASIKDKDDPLLYASKRKAWSRRYGEIVGLSDLAKWIVVCNSGHYIQHDQPETVVEAIKDVYLQYKKGKDK